MPVVSRLHPSCLILAALAGWWVNTATAQVRLNEFMTSNDATVAPGADTDGRVLINEGLTQPADGGHDAIELLDTTDGLESRQVVLPVAPEPRRFLRLIVQR